jgi:hypothetical protein
LPFASYLLLEKEMKGKERKEKEKKKKRKKGRKDRTHDYPSTFSPSHYKCPLFRDIYYSTPVFGNVNFKIPVLSSRWKLSTTMTCHA